MSDGSESSDLAPGNHPGPRCIIVTPPRSFLQSVLAFGEQLASRRDAALGSIAVVYFFGYVSWALYAVQRDLGMIPVLKAQYLAAGIQPAIVVLLAWWLVSLNKRLREKLYADPRIKEILQQFGSWLLVVGFVMWIGGVFFEKALESVGVSAKWIFMP